MQGRSNSSSGLKLHILGGTVEPPAPADNTIWVNTANEITDWLIQYDEPSEKKEGLLWISTSTSAATKINVLWQHALVFGFGTPKQWVSGAWVTKTAKIRVNGGWTDSQSFIYNSGSFNENYATDIAISTHVLSASRSKDAQYVSCYTSRSAVSQHAYGYFYFNQKIDVTNVSKVKFTVSASNQNNDSGGVETRGWRCVVTSGNGANQWDSPTRGSSKRYDNPSVSSPATIEVDVSTLTGQNYIGLAQYSYNGSTTLRIHAVELIT